MLFVTVEKPCLSTSRRAPLCAACRSVHSRPMSMARRLKTTITTLEGVVWCPLIAEPIVEWAPFASERAASFTNKYR